MLVNFSTNSRTSRVQRRERELAERGQDVVVESAAIVVDGLDGARFEPTCGVLVASQADGTRDRGSPTIS